MTIAAEKLREELTKLNEADRGALAHFLIQSLDASPDGDAEILWDAELERRVDEIRNGQAIGVPADQVFSDLLTKHS